MPATLTYRRWTPAEEDHLELLRVEGCTAKEIAAAWPLQFPGRTVRSIRQALQRRRLKRPRKVRDAATLAWLTSGQGIPAIVAATGLSRSLVLKLRTEMRALGYEMADQRGRNGYGLNRNG